MPGVRNRARTRGQTIIIYTCKVKSTKPTNNYFFKTFYIDDVRLKKKKKKLRLTKAPLRDLQIWEP